MIDKCNGHNCKKEAKFKLTCPNKEMNISGKYCKTCTEEVTKPYGGLLHHWIKEELS